MSSHKENTIPKNKKGPHVFAIKNIFLQNFSSHCNNSNTKQTNVNSISYKDETIIPKEDRKMSSKDILIPSIQGKVKKLHEQWEAKKIISPEKQLKPAGKAFNVNPMHSIKKDKRGIQSNRETHLTPNPKLDIWTIKKKFEPSKNVSPVLGYKIKRYETTQTMSYTPDRSHSKSITVDSKNHTIAHKLSSEENLIFSSALTKRKMPNYSIDYIQNDDLSHNIMLIPRKESIKTYPKLSSTDLGDNVAMHCAYRIPLVYLTDFTNVKVKHFNPSTTVPQTESVSREENFRKLYTGGDHKFRPDNFLRLGARSTPSKSLPYTEQIFDIQNQPNKFFLNVPDFLTLREPNKIDMTNAIDNKRYSMPTSINQTISLKEHLRRWLRDTNVWFKLHGKHNAASPPQYKKFRSLKSTQSFDKSNHSKDTNSKLWISRLLQALNITSDDTLNDLSPTAKLGKSHSTSKLAKLSSAQPQDITLSTATNRKRNTILNLISNHWSGRHIMGNEATKGNLPLSSSALINESSSVANSPNHSPDLTRRSSFSFGEHHSHSNRHRKKHSRGTANGQNTKQDINKRPSGISMNLDLRDSAVYNKEHQQNDNMSSTDNNLIEGNKSSKNKDRPHHHRLLLHKNKQYEYDKHPLDKDDSDKNAGSRVASPDSHMANGKLLIPTIQKIEEIDVDGYEYEPPIPINQDDTYLFHPGQLRQHTHNVLQLPPLSTAAVSGGRTDISSSPSESHHHDDSVKHNIVVPSTISSSTSAPSSSLKKRIFKFSKKFAFSSSLNSTNSSFNESDELMATEKNKMAETNPKSGGGGLMGQKDTVSNFEFPITATSDNEKDAANIPIAEGKNGQRRRSSASTALESGNKNIKRILSNQTLAVVPTVTNSSQETLTNSPINNKTNDSSDNITTTPTSTNHSPSLPNNGDNNNNNVRNAEIVRPSLDKLEQAMEKRKYILTELIETEQEYVKDLGVVVNGYMTAVKEQNPVPPEALIEKEKIVWGNIEQIYEWHKDVFCKEIEKCMDNPDLVGWVFVKYERRFQMYVVYCQNKPKSEYIVSEYIDSYFEEVRVKLGQKLTLPDLLIKPVQRVMKYQLILKEYLRLVEKMNGLIADKNAAITEKEDQIKTIDTTLIKKAVEVMCIVPKTANDMMKLSRLQGWDGKVSAQGKLLLQDTLLVSQNAPSQPFKGKEWQVFLFEQIVLFSEPTAPSNTSGSSASAVAANKKFTNLGYIYKNSIKTSKLSLTERILDENGEESPADECRFVLSGKSPDYGEIHFVCQAPNKEAKAVWINQIKSMLSLQRDFLRALQSPIAYQKHLKAPGEDMLGLVVSPAAASLGATGKGSNMSTNVSKGSAILKSANKASAQNGKHSGAKSGFSSLFSSNNSSSTTTPTVGPSEKALHHQLTREASKDSSAGHGLKRNYRELLGLGKKSMTTANVSSSNNLAEPKRPDIPKSPPLPQPKSGGFLSGNKDAQKTSVLSSLPENMVPTKTHSNKSQSMTPGGSSSSTGLLATLRKAVSQPSRSKLNEAQRKLIELRQQDESKILSSPTSDSQNGLEQSFKVLQSSIPSPTSPTSIKMTESSNTSNVPCEKNNPVNVSLPTNPNTNLLLLDTKPNSTIINEQGQQPPLKKDQTPQTQSKPINKGPIEISDVEILETMQEIQDSMIHPNITNKRTSRTARLSQHHHNKYNFKHRTESIIDWENNALISDHFINFHLFSDTYMRMEPLVGLVLHNNLIRSHSSGWESDSSETSLNNFSFELMFPNNGLIPLQNRKTQLQCIMLHRALRNYYAAKNNKFGNKKAPIFPLSWYKISKDLNIPKTSVEKLLLSKICEQVYRQHHHHISMIETKGRTNVEFEYDSNNLPKVMPHEDIEVKLFNCETTPLSKSKHGDLSDDHLSDTSESAHSVRVWINFERFKVNDMGSYFLYFDEFAEFEKREPCKLKKSKSTSNIDLIYREHTRQYALKDILTWIGKDLAFDAPPSQAELQKITSFKRHNCFPFYLLVLEPPYILWKPTISESSQSGILINWRCPPDIIHTFTLLPFTIQIQHSSEKPLSPTPSLSKELKNLFKKDGIDKKQNDKDANLPNNNNIKNGMDNTTLNKWVDICYWIRTQSAIIDKHMVLRDSPQFRLRIKPETALFPTSNIVSVPYPDQNVMTNGTKLTNSNTVAQSKPTPSHLSCSDSTDVLTFKHLPSIPTFTGDDPKIWLSGFFDEYLEQKLLYSGKTCRLYTLLDKRDKHYHPDVDLTDPKYSGKNYVGKYVERNVRGYQSVTTEYQILRKLQPHPNIVSTFGAYATPRRYIIILEKLNGMHVIDHFRTMGAYSEAQVWDLAYQVCTALEYLHSHKIAHLDICPENIFIVNHIFPPPNNSYYDKGDTYNNNISSLPGTSQRYQRLHGIVKLTGFSYACHFPLTSYGTPSKPCIFLNPFHVAYQAPEILMKRVLHPSAHNPNSNPLLSTSSSYSLDHTYTELDSTTKTAKQDALPMLKSSNYSLQHNPVVTKSITSSHTGYVFQSYPYIEDTTSAQADISSFDSSDSRKASVTTNIVDTDIEQSAKDLNLSPTDQNPSKKQSISKTFQRKPLQSKQAIISSVRTNAENSIYFEAQEKLDMMVRRCSQDQVLNSTLLASTTPYSSFNSNSSGTNAKYITEDLDTLHQALIKQSHLLTTTIFPSLFPSSISSLSMTAALFSGSAANQTVTMTNGEPNLKSDVWSLGILLLYLFTAGHIPFASPISLVSPYCEDDSNNQTNNNVGNDGTTSPSVNMQTKKGEETNINNSTKSHSCQNIDKHELCAMIGRIMAFDPEFYVNHIWQNFKFYQNTKGPYRLMSWEAKEFLINHLLVTDVNKRSSIKKCFTHPALIRGPPSKTADILPYQSWIPLYDGLGLHTQK